jgi:crotonobetainyl-CoA:carnitine CoA-transferase CaiB-like acyl-CoA transferase
MTQVLSGPFCTQLLGDLGADVIKIEPPSGDGTRSWGPPYVRGESAYYLSLNRNKKSVVVDLKKGKKGLDLMKRIASSSDVFIENFRPGVAKSLGLSYDSLRAWNRSIIYCSISGYGQEGPWSRKPGYDITAFAASGIMSITGEPNRPPVKTGVPIADIGAAMFAAIAILCAIIERRRTGKGARIDISMLDCMISWLSFQAALYFATGEVPAPLGSAHPVIAPYQAFKASDQYFVLAVGNDSQWIKACSAMGQPELAQDQNFSTNDARIRNRDALAEKLNQIFGRHSASSWLAKFEKAGVPCASINSVEEALNSEHSKWRHLVVEVPHPNGGKFHSLAQPIRFGKRREREEVSRFAAPPKRGGNTTEVLLDLGLTQSEIAKLRREGVVI